MPARAALNPTPLPQAREALITGRRRRHDKLNALRAPLPACGEGLGVVAGARYACPRSRCPCTCSRVVQRHQIGAIARRDPPQLAAQAEELGRIGRRHAAGFLQRQAQPLHGVAHRARPCPAQSPRACRRRWCTGRRGRSSSRRRARSSSRSPPTGGIASVTSIIFPRGSRRDRHAQRWRRGRGSRRRSGRTTRPRFSSAAPTAPGSRLVIGVIALNRWVTPRMPAAKPSRSLLVIGGGVAGADDHATRGQRAQRGGIEALRRQRQHRDARCRARRPASSSSAPGVWNLDGSCTPLRAALRYGPSRWMPRMPGTPCAIASRVAAMARRITVDVVADQRRHQAGRAELAMRRGDACAGRRRWARR